jgi:hypothetical protein
MVLIRSLFTLGAATQALSQQAGSFEQVRHVNLPSGYTY